jgi:hypothetical protein
LADRKKALLEKQSGERMFTIYEFVVFPKSESRKPAGQCAPPPPRAPTSRVANVQPVR